MYFFYLLFDINNKIQLIKDKSKKHLFEYGFEKILFRNQILKEEQFILNLLCICQSIAYMKIVLRWTIFRFKKKMQNKL